MKLSHILIMTVVAFAVVFAGCDSTGGGGGGSYEIGDTGPSGVGIVFYVTDGGSHGLEAAPEDQNTSAQWSNVTDAQLGTTLTAIGTGSANTEYIINQVGHTGSAAQICENYRTAEEGDWFLPSKDELNELYSNRAVVGGFAPHGYWSSSEADADEAWVQDFNNGLQDPPAHKGLNYRVRAVRAL